MSKLANKIVLVSGASKGIGAAIARQLAADGATVIVNYSSSVAGADATVAAIKAAGGNAVAMQGDFSREADIVRVFGAVQQQYGKLDVLVNNAGVYQFGPLEELTEAHFRVHFDLNVMGLLMACREAVKLMGDAGGSIINIGSVVGRMSTPNAVVYSATKGAVDSLTVSLSKELGARKIRVNALNPGMISTEGTTSIGITEGEFGDYMVAHTPLGRIGTGADVAPVASFLASDDSAWVTGQYIMVGGGVTF
ncbi:SDR family NAD(P)-dependent oxidoreductase [Rugamonas sp.]|uniref:SDR family NAD(P)-dependent oxidoreductase n=1 Tax=Rugamonas sp. TaxID=1926287 RepID=UPI0025EAD52D|nr:glucose 1-dehydrogenase [Rugamonas sp.]